jgi:hypothetical protein
MFARLTVTIAYFSRPLACEPTRHRGSDRNALSGAAVVGHGEHSGAGDVGSAGARERPGSESAPASHFGRSGDAQSKGYVGVKHLDETGWKQARQKRWLWDGFTSQVARFVLCVGRGWSGLRALFAKLHSILVL